MSVSTSIVKQKQIRYLNKDFYGFKRDLMGFTQAHQSGSFQDFNEASPGMAILEMVAYVGDVLSYYQDVQFDELKQDSARQIDNVVSNAKQLGYRPAGKRAATGTETFFIQVPATSIGNSIVPDDSYSPILRMGSRVRGPNGVPFETLDDVIFSASDGRMVTGSQFDPTSGLPTFFALRKDVAVTAGQTVSETFTLGDFEQFLTIELSNKDVIEVLSVVDSDGNDWFEVDYLAQATVFDSAANTGDDSDVVPYILTLTPVPRRFVVDRNLTTSKTTLIFGSGDGVSFDDELIPNLADLALPLPNRATFSAFPIDPQNFLKTGGLGLSPYNTNVTVTYRFGGGKQTNVPKGTVKSVDNAILDFSSVSLDPVKQANVLSSLECTNLAATDGGDEAETISEIKANSSAFFAAQNRVVTREDYIARVLSLPAKFGKPYKVYVKKNGLSSQALDLHVLSQDSNGFLTTASTALKTNIQTYLTPFRMMTSGVNILDSNITNFRVNFGVVVSRKLNRTEILSNCLSAIKDYFDTDFMQIGQPIVISDLEAIIQKVYGVISVFSLKITNVAGTIDSMTYSGVTFDVNANTANKIIYCPDNSIFELKYPNIDIKGAPK